MNLDNFTLVLPLPTVSVRWAGIEVDFHNGGEFVAVECDKGLLSLRLVWHVTWPWEPGREPQFVAFVFERVSFLCITRARDATGLLGAALEDLSVVKPQRDEYRHMDVGGPELAENRLVFAFTDGSALEVDADSVRLERVG
jgi:hypothetical protein